MDTFTGKYATQTDFYFRIQKRGFPDFATTADWTPATGDTKITKDGGTIANSTNNPVVVAGSGSVWWKLTLTATEMTAARIGVQIVDSATKAVEDDGFLVRTFGNASAAYQFDLGSATVTVGTDGITDVSLSSGAKAVIADEIADGVMDGARTDHVLAGSMGETITALAARLPASGTLAKATDITTAITNSGSVLSRGLTQAGSTSSTLKLDATDAGATGAYIGHMAVVRLASGATDHGIITANDGSTKVATIDREWINIPAGAGIPYEIL